MRTPGPDNPIAISANPNRVRIRFGDRTIVDTRRALTLREASLPPALYVPREDVDMTLLARTDHITRCPYKGEAAYFTIAVDGRSAENAVWTYEHPYPAVAAIAGHLAFYPSRVTIEEQPN